MAATEQLPHLGSCPNCSTEIFTTDVIIKYEKNGQPALYAECSGCRDVVNPN